MLSERLKKMTLKEILNFRRAVRLYDAKQPLDPEVVKACIEEAQLAPTSSNLQLWEAYHITNPQVKKQLTEACLGQTAVSSADQIVVFVTRGDKAIEHAKRVMDFEMGNVERNSPQERWAARQERYKVYYGKIIPLLYTRFFGLFGIFRKAMACITGLFRPITRGVMEGDIVAKNHKSCALVAQTFMIAMAEKGYDTCPIEGCDEVRVARILKLPRGAKVSLLVSCGIRAEGGVWGERFRLPFDEQYHRI